jgi:hypothetical protein
MLLPFIYLGCRAATFIMPVTCDLRTISTKTLIAELENSWDVILSSHKSCEDARNNNPTQGPARFHCVVESLKYTA